jgi:Ca2+-binding RTX toxin-like protein
VPFGADGHDVIDGGDDITITNNGSGLTITDGGVTPGDDADAILGDNGLITRTVLGPESWQTYLPPFEDVIREIQRFDDIDLTCGNDTIFGDAGQDIIHGQRGDDVIDGGTDDDELFGELGNDTIAGAQGNDILIADVGCIERAFNENGLPRINENKSWHRDVLLIDIVDANDDMLHGGAGEDVLFGQRGDDTLDGDGDDDLLIGDTATNVVPFETDIPQIVNTIRLIGMTDGADIPVVIPFGGAVIVSPVTLRPGEFDLTSPDLTLVPDVVESFSQTAVPAENYIRASKARIA